jgi:hypothetical protein
MNVKTLISAIVISSWLWYGLFRLMIWGCRLFGLLS